MPAAIRAGFATRALALGTDVLIVDAAAILVGVGVALTARILGIELRGGDPVVALLAGAGWVVAFAGYLGVFWSLAGQTPGMRLMGIRVVDARGSPPRPARSVIRLGGMALCVLTWGIGFLLVLVDDRRRGLHDMIGGTSVVRDGDDARRATRHARTA